MTTLDIFLKSLPNDIHLIYGHQKTSSSLHLSYSEEDFLKLVKFYPEDQIIFRFLEKTPKDEFLVHLAFLKGDFSLQITIEVRNRSREFGIKLRTIFPSAEVYLHDLNH